MFMCRIPILGLCSQGTLAKLVVSWLQIATSFEGIAKARSIQGSTV